MKYHISKNGIPTKCTATERPCPLGGDSVHFETEEKAYAYIAKQYSRNILGTFKKLVSPERQKAIIAGFANAALKIMDIAYCYGDGFSAGIKTGARAVSGQSLPAQLIRSFANNPDTHIKFTSSPEKTETEQAKPKSYSDLFEKDAL